MKWSVADCETDPFLHGRIPKPFLWGFYDGTEYREFKDTSEFGTFLSTFSGRCYAHNGGRFDWHYLLDSFDPGKIMVINGRIAKARLGKSDLRDSYNLLPTPLGAYAKDDIDYGIFESGQREKPENMRKIRDYLKSDCIYLYQYLSAYFQEYPDALTQAGAAMKIWRSLGGEVPKSTPAFYERISRYYYGGRVEYFESGVLKMDAEVADIKSAYPFAMMQPHPIGVAYDVDRNPRDSDFSRCFWTVDASSNGVLPLRNESGAISFPDTRATFRVPGWEIVAGLETDTLQIFKVKSCIRFSTYTTFAEYVDYFYRKKIDAERTEDHAGRLIAKLFLNSLYGKFGANPNRYREHAIFPYGEDHSADGWRGGDLLGSRQLYARPLPDWQVRFYNVATAASITSFVRAYLWRALCRADRAIYCDTDSIIANRPNVQYGNELGEWEREAVADEIAIAGKKLYALWKDDKPIKARSKGVRLTAEEIRTIAQGGKIAYHSDAPSFSVRGNRGPNGDPARLFITREVMQT